MAVRDPSSNAEKIQALSRRISMHAPSSPEVSSDNEVQLLKARVRQLESENQALRESQVRALAEQSDASPAIKLSQQTIEKLKEDNSALEARVLYLQTELAKQSVALQEAHASARVAQVVSSPHRPSGASLSLPAPPVHTRSKSSDTHRLSLSSSSNIAPPTSASAPSAEASANGSGDGVASDKDSTPRVLEFTEDSPFFRSSLLRLDSRVNNFGNRLKNVTKAAGEFCQAGNLFAQACGNLSQEMFGDFQEMERLNTKPSLGTAMQKLGELLQQMQTITSHLVLSCDTLLVQALFDFRQKYVKACKDSGRGFAKATEDYEAALMSYLGQKLPKGGQSGSSSFFSRNKKEMSEAELQEQVNNLRRRFELARFDHLRALNEMHLERLLEVIELVCASFFGFVTFFHEGEYFAQSVKPDIEVINASVQGKRVEYAALAKGAADQRGKLERGLSSVAFSVGDAFPVVHDEKERDRQFVNVRGKQVRVEKQGYLLKQSSNMKKDWKRRWFALQDGQLFYFRSEEVSLPPILFFHLVPVFPFL